jgi:hypothetical protein
VLKSWTPGDPPCKGLCHLPQDARRNSFPTGYPPQG